MKKRGIILSICLAIILIACKDQKKETDKEKTATTEAAAKDATVSVTKDNFAYAMADLAMQKEFVQGADNTWNHHRRPMPLDEQPAPLMNRDTDYSFAILDGGGDVAITLPENDGRYMSLHVVNHDHVTVDVLYGPGRYVIPKSKTTDFFWANVRMQVNPKSEEDIKKVNGYQDQLKVEHLNGYKPKSFKVTNWNMDEFKKVLDHYVEIAGKEGVRGTMGTIDNPVSLEARNRGVSIATGLLPDKDAVYLTEKYELKDGETHKVTYQIPEMRDPKLGFYSITIYGDDQYLKTDEGSNISNSEIKLNPDGKSFDIYYVPKDKFDDVKQNNKLLMPTQPFWICFRIYMPSDGVVNGNYKLPEIK
ncbi:DUF1254 domain-containing protein [Galbibacter pacificus]|uniref:DUF1254 domain-containing protein n=1 Tax=Galbibacter pacificus TaxID=2996052 RepID=A0ABT6FS03_9FLAO|nr:DUF1254 domain-containing protein [Galbibacter pacificus]MDG3582830.1 DUF1254 domain-containing protein [Galbibacter pacificus]MDG3586051.1 DUF1254 domain-containing protein [Galbibacter pacificus]